nr:hypothetical protein [Tanacetum cinerariifolium]
MYYLTDKEMQAYLDKEENLRKAVEEARLIAMSKPKVIKVVQEEAEKIGLDPNKITSTKVRKKFKKARDVKHQVLKREHSKKRYERLKKIPEELGIQFSLPSLVLEQASSQTLRRNRKHIKLEPGVKVPGLECNRSLPEGVPFVNYMVIKEPEYGISLQMYLVIRHSKDGMISTRIKPETIIDIKIHPNTSPTVLSIYINNDKSNFDVHDPFKFSDFGITELDELGPIIQKKKNSSIKELMTSLSKRYERLKKIPEELGIQFSLSFLKEPKGERKPRKGQNRIKTGQKREAWRSQEKFKAVAVEKGRKTEENAKRMVENAYT